ncbi:AAA family ATPase [Streptomyces lonarensis]|uniref:AAA family ATPase n=1 Tax=Streptomyces lonarensis TaxID=700599 RepID=A0A7X6D464_9ACTN|nr:AAA family ATPase [Streptomyces lonarensis]NJQ07847.1 AAA family ATPase [Streptomyces lonarensis]
MTPGGPEARQRRAAADLAWLRGVDAYTAGAYGDAEDGFRAAVREDPGMADAWLGLHALRVGVAEALGMMFEHRDRFGEQRAEHGRPLSSWYWLGWWVQPVLESPRDLLLAHASQLLDARRLPELDAAIRRCPPPGDDARSRFLHGCRAYLAKDWEALFRHTTTLLDDPLLGVEASLFAGMARVRLGMYGQAEPVLATALARCRSEQPQRKELRYWLARAREGSGRTAAAIPLYRAVQRADPAFLDTAARLLALAEEEPDWSAPPDEGDAAGLPAPGPVPSQRTARPGPVGAPPGEASAPAGPGGDGAPPSALARALAELEDMVGLEPVKEHVRSLSAQLRMARLRSGQGLPARTPQRHLVFSGPAGTGKTTVARIVARVLHALGAVEHDRLVEAHRADMVGEFLGQTAVKTDRLVDSAVGGVLFVDEAHGLAHSGYAQGDAYGDEALQVLLKRAEDSRDRLVVILAGHPEGMRRLFGANPALASRFPARVDFPTYGPPELAAIAERAARLGGDRWDAEAWDELRSVCDHVAERGWTDELGNGRFVRELYESSCAFRDVRLAALPSAPERSELTTLRLPDLMRAYGEVIGGRGSERADDRGLPPG